MMDSRGDLQTRKDTAARTLRQVGTCKGVFTKEIKKLASTAEYFLTKTTDLTVDQINSPDVSLINCAQSFLDSLDRLIAKFIDMVTNLDDWKKQITDVWEDTDDKLIEAIDKQDDAFAKYDKDYVDITRKYEKVLDTCKDISNQASRAQTITENAPPSTNESRPIVTKTQGVFRPQPDLKPVFLAKDCNLIEFVEFGKAYVLYMQSSQPIPKGAIFSHLRIAVDAWWVHYIETVGLNQNSDVAHFTKIMDLAGRKKFPVHGRRMRCFTHAQKSDTTSHFREIIESIKLAEWSSFNEEAAALHIFLSTTTDEVAKRACFKILTESPEGDIGAMMNKISAIEAFPERKLQSFSAKPVITNPTETPRKTCTACKRQGHVISECWGRCLHCKRFGHKSELCRNKPSEPVVKKNEGARKKTRSKKKAKTIKELADLVETFRLNSQDISEDSSESDSQDTQHVNRVQVGPPQANHNSRRGSRSTSYAEITEISNDEVIYALNRTKIAAINIKKTKNSKGMSHTDGIVSNKLDFRHAKVESLLLDSGAGVNIVGEEIVKDTKVKVKRLKHDRFVTEASGNRLNIIGSCIFYIKLPFLNRPKRLECLVLRGKSVDREILISCQTLLKWDLIHSSFGQETVTSYCNRVSTNYLRNFENKIKLTKMKHVSISQLYSKSKVPTDQLLEKIPEDCKSLKQKIIKKHTNNFKEKLGKTDRINCDPIQLRLDPNKEVRPIKNTHCYDIPIHLKEAAKEEFNEMLDSGIIVPCDEQPTEWASLAFPRKKPNSNPPKCRWVVDFRDLNKALDRPVWGGESSGQLLRHLDASAKYFAVFDAVSGFHQVPITPESSDLLNITTQLGNYKYTVLAQGLCASQDLFNIITKGETQVDPNFKIIKNVDDFLLFGSSIKDLEEQIEKLMTMCAKINLKLAPSKFKLSTAVKFGGTIISSNRIKEGNVIFIDPPDKRIIAVTEMRNPTTKKELRILCGMVSSLGEWFPSVQFNMKNLRLGCAENTRFKWNQAMENEFIAVKHIFTHQIRLSPLDMNKRINIATDGANSSGIGYIIFQNEDDLNPGKNVRIIKANSSGLKDSQKLYSAVETELLALKFACESAFFYLYACPEIHIFTDCLSLEGMFTKTLDKHKNLRIRAMIEKLMVFNMTFHHVPGEKHNIVDCFSRLTREIREAQHYSLCDTIKLSDSAAKLHQQGQTGFSVKAIKRGTTTRPIEDDPWVDFLGEVAMGDNEYLTMVHHIEAGTDIKDISTDCELQKCHNYKDQLGVITLKGGQNLIIRNNEILVPGKERKNMLALAHATNHRGEDGMTRQMRGRVFWEGMKSEIKQLVATCEKCQINGLSKKQDATEISHASMFNLSPNHTLHADFCEYGGQDYMVLVDRLTGYIMAERTPNKGTDSAIAVVRNWNLLFGPPIRIISDDGPAYRNDFRSKLGKFKIRHKNSSCYHPESNSLAERAVGSLKRSLRRSPRSLTPVALKEVIFQINSNVSQDMTGSANDRFLLRSVRGDMPNSINHSIKPQELIERRIYNHEKRMKGKNKNKSEYPVGSRVRIQNSKSKLFDTNGTIIEYRWTDTNQVVSYVIRTDDNLITTRHRKFLKLLHPKNDPNYEKQTYLEGADVTLNTDHNTSDDTAGTEKVEKHLLTRRSDRIKTRSSLKKITSLRVHKVKAHNSGDKMGATCSTKLKNAQEEIKILKEKLSRYEAGSSDHSIRASQTNIGLFNLAEETNEECGCESRSSGGSMLSIIEIIAILITVIIILYIAYGCCIKMHQKRKEEKERSKEKRRRFIMKEMGRMGTSGQAENKTTLAIEHDGRCDQEHLHLPRHFRNENNFPQNTDNIERETLNQSTQHTATFT